VYLVGRCATVELGRRPVSDMLGQTADTLIRLVTQSGVDKWAVTPKTLGL
jgi:hypothetical protein